jgi:hypothetical protein
MPYTAPNSVPYRSTAATDALPSHAPRRKYPLGSDCPIQFDAYAFDQDYEMRLSAFPPAPRNTLATAATLGSLSDATAILASYTQPQPTAAGLGRFTAEFRTVPASWDDYSKTATYVFPGFPGVLGGYDVREIFSEEVQIRVRHDYFVADPSNILSGASAGGAPVNAASLLDTSGAAVQCVYSTAEIPIIKKTVFLPVYSGTVQVGTRVNLIVPAGGKTVGSVFYWETLPTQAAYKGFIANAAGSGAGKGWKSDVWGGANNTIGNVGQFVFKESLVENYGGNIFDRVTIYVLVK